MKQLVFISTFLGLMGFHAMVWGQGRPNLVVEIQVERVVEQVDGSGRVKTVLEPAETTQRDDVLVYTLRWRNTGDAAASGAVLNDPIPAGTTLLRGSLEGEGSEATYSVDGEHYSRWPREKVADANGQETWKDVAESSVRHIRLKLAEAVPPGGQGEASFKVLVQ